MTSVREKSSFTDPGIQYRLMRSRAMAGKKPVRTIMCPKCGFHLLDVYGSDHYLIQVKCRKCKFNDVIDTALFRTMSRKRSLRYKFAGRHRS